MPDVPLPLPVIDERTVARYRANYGLDDTVGSAHVRRHWELETALTSRLLRSSPEDRWRVFEACYSELYAQLPWLHDAAVAMVESYDHWDTLLPVPVTIFEVGSGRARLLQHLAARGHRCVATEITQERGRKHASQDARLEWHITDGIHLARFEAASTYDVVISSQVIEHMHPDDVATHFEHVRTILKPGGRYFFDTPHRGAGPADLSRVFDLDQPVCMHLKEYTYLELSALTRRAGYSAVGAVLFLAKPRIGPMVSTAYLRYCQAWDGVFAALALRQATERSLRRALRFGLLKSNIWLCATK